MRGVGVAGSRPGASGFATRAWGHEAIAPPSALILAGGLGTRLRPVVADRPKPMAAVADRPFLEYQLGFLHRWGIRHVVLCVGYRHEQIRAHFGDGSAWGLALDYSVEDRPLGTGGAMKLAEPFVEGTFLLLNGDSYLDLDLAAFLAAHRANLARDPACAATMALARVPDASAYGSVELDQDGRIRSFVEKTSITRNDNLINAGIYAIDFSVMKTVPGGMAVSVEREVFPALLRSGSRLYGWPSDGFFVDIGTPEGYSRFQKYIERQDRCP